MRRYKVLNESIHKLGKMNEYTWNDRINDCYPDDESTLGEYIENNPEEVTDDFEHYVSKKLEPYIRKIMFDRYGEEFIELVELAYGLENKPIKKIEVSEYEIEEVIGYAMDNADGDFVKGYRATRYEHGEPDYWENITVDWDLTTCAYYTLTNDLGYDSDNDDIAVDDTLLSDLQLDQVFVDAMFESNGRFRTSFDKIVNKVLPRLPRFVTELCQVYSRLTRERVNPRIKGIEFRKVSNKPCIEVEVDTLGKILLVLTKNCRFTIENDLLTQYKEFNKTYVVDDLME